jgi:hypothetical protein
METVDQEKPALKLLTHFIEYYNQHNLEKLSQLFCTKNPTHLWGTAPSDDFLGVEEIMQYLLRNWVHERECKLQRANKELYIGHMGRWVSGYMHYVAGHNTVVMPNIRFSLYAQREKGEWRISQIHWSQAYPNLFHTSLEQMNSC